MSFVRSAKEKCRKDVTRYDYPQSDNIHFPDCWALCRNVYYPIYVIDCRHDCVDAYIVVYDSTANFLEVTV